MRILFRFLLFTMCLTYPAASAAASSPFWDLTDHWAERQIQEALAEGWVNGYPNGSFMPENTITKAEFIKMLSAAIHLLPGGETVNFLHEASPTYGPLPLDLGTHWFAAQGWLETASAGGLIHPSDLEDQRLRPDLPVTRQEIATMVVRALGLTTHGQTSAPVPFVDWEQIDPSALEHVLRAAEIGILAGYADATFGPGRPATRAEAVTVVSRVVNWMTQGIDQQIMVFVRRPSFLHPNDVPQPLNLPVPVQEIDGVLYVAARSLFGAAVDRLYPETEVTFSWDPLHQTLIFDYGVPYNFQAGATTSLFPPHREQSPPKLPAPARLLYGELMVPVYSATERVPIWAEDPVWEPQAKILIISLHDPSQRFGENETWPA